MSEKLTGEIQVACASDMEIAERVSRGIDPMWREHIRKTTAKEIARVEGAKQKLEAAAQPGEDHQDTVVRHLTDHSANRDRNLVFDLLTAREWVKRHENEGSPTQRDLVEKYTAESNSIRELVLGRGFAVSEQVMTDMRIDELELIRLIDRGQFVVVADHDELVFPAFQFASPQARLLVERLEGRSLKYQTPDPKVIQLRDFNPYPSWQRTLWWFGVYGSEYIDDEPKGSAPIDLIEDGHIQELTERLEIFLS